MPHLHFQITIAALLFTFENGRSRGYWKACLEGQVRVSSLSAKIPDKITQGSLSGYNLEAYHFRLALGSDLACSSSSEGRSLLVFWPWLWPEFNLLYLAWIKSDELGLTWEVACLVKMHLGLHGRGLNTTASSSITIAPFTQRTLSVAN